MTGQNRRRFVKPLGGIIAAAALVAALALTPAGSLAASFITIFEPQQIAAVPVTQADLQSLRGLPDLSSFGTMSQTSSPQFQQVSSAAEAQRQSGLSLLAPASLPAGVPAKPTYNVATQGTASFAFSAAKASAAASGKALPTMPADLDGSTLQATVGPAVIAVYGNNSSYNGGGSDIHNFPSLIIGEAAAPKVTSTRATVKEIEDYLLAMPGVPADLAAAIRAIGDPSSTLPIPIPVERANAQQIQVQGVNGLTIGDNTGIFSVIVWQKNGMVYGVGGTLPQDQALAIANSLH